MAKRFSSRLLALNLVAHACCVSAPLLLHASNIAAAQSNPQSSVIRTLSDKGVYWYELYRFDLAVQSFNKILLLDPSNASALRWQGLIDLVRGDIQAANVWLGKLQIIHGNHPFAIELQQAIALAGEKDSSLQNCVTWRPVSKYPPIYHCACANFYPKPHWVQLPFKFTA